MSDTPALHLARTLATLATEHDDRSLAGQDLLATWDKTEAGLATLVRVALALDALVRAERSCRVFESGLGVSIFRDKSTRTRYAFRAGCNLLGLATEELDEGTSQIAHGETVEETAAMVSFLTEAIGIRDDLFYGQGHTYIERFARALDSDAAAGAYASRPAVVNLQSDLDHPTQTLADLCHLTTTYGGFEALRGKKVAVTWAHSPSYGKPMSVPQGLIALLPRFGMHVVLAHPEGYELDDAVMAKARDGASSGGGGFSVTDDMDAAFAGADVIYPKSWAPMAVLEARSAARAEGDLSVMGELERRCLELNAEHVGWAATDARYATTSKGSALYMHCLPADITGVNCAHGEVDPAVFDRNRSALYRQASYKPFVIAAAVLTAQTESFAAHLARLIDEPTHRRPA